MNNNICLSVNGLTKIFKPAIFARHKEPFRAVDDISFTLSTGEILGILGPNGAGKTTTLQMLLGLLTPSLGSITYFAKDFFKHRTEILRMLSFASTYLKLPGNSTIYENMDIFGRLYGLNKLERAKNIEEKLQFFGMWQVRNQKVFGLSAGQMTRVMLAKAFLHNPKVVLLDEPTASLDPDIALEVRHFISEQRRLYNTTILLSSHNMAEVEDICDRVLVLKNGRIIASETPEALARSVSLARLELVVDACFDEALAKYLYRKNLDYKKQGLGIEIEIDEKVIAEFLMGLSAEGISYTQISIEKPKLEDYFLEVARQAKEIKD